MNHAPNLTIDEKQEAIIQEFAGLDDDWMRKYEYLIELGRALPAMDSKYKIDDNLIRGCQSQVWLHTFMDAGKVYFEVESEAFIVKGIAALLIKILSGHTPEEIKEAELYCIDSIGLQKHLSPVRSNGLLSLVKQMKSCGQPNGPQQENTP